MRDDDKPTRIMNIGAKNLFKNSSDIEDDI